MKVRVLPVRNDRRRQPIFACLIQPCVFHYQRYEEGRVAIEEAHD